MESWINEEWLNSFLDYKSILDKLFEIINSGSEECPKCKNNKKLFFNPGMNRFTCYNKYDDGKICKVRICPTNFLFHFSRLHSKELKNLRFYAIAIILESYFRNGYIKIECISFIKNLGFSKYMILTLKSFVFNILENNFNYEDWKKDRFNYLIVKMIDPKKLEDYKNSFEN